MNKKIKLLFLLLLFFSLDYRAQKTTQELAEFQKSLSTYKEDTNKVKKILEFVRSQDELDRTSFKYLQQALSLSNRLNYAQGQYAANRELSYYFSNVQVSNVKAMKAANNAVVVAEKMNKSQELMEAYQLMGRQYRNTNKHKAAVSYLQKALTIAEKTNNSTASFVLDNDLGIAHPHSDSAKRYFSKALYVLDNTPNFDTNFFGGRSKGELRGIVVSNMGKVYTHAEAEADKTKSSSVKKKSSRDTTATKNKKSTKKAHANKKQKSQTKEVHDADKSLYEFASKHRSDSLELVAVKENDELEMAEAAKTKTRRFVALLVLCMAVLFAAFYFRRKRNNNGNE